MSGGYIMLFRALGSLEVRTDNGWSGIGAPKWRALLAALLLRPGQAVSIESLIDDLWSNDAPAGARKLVSGYALRLRRLMGDVDGRVLVTRSPGYQLVLGRADLDVSRFEDLLADARQAIAGHDVRQTEALLAEALALWRGPALADVPDGPLVAAESCRLEELRLDAVELRIEADLASGRQAGVVAELRMLAVEHPLRERLWGLLIRALCESGSPAEALAVYGQARAAIAAELGTAPGPDLQLLHQRLLTGDPAVGHRAQVQPAAGVMEPVDSRGSREPVVPRQLPAAVRHFVGRTEALARLSGLLEETSGAGGAVAMAVIGGAAGIGKTALAVHWAHQIAQRFPDGQLYVNLRGFDPSGVPLTPAEAIAGFFDAFHVPLQRIPLSLQAQAGLYRSLLARRRMLIVLDNARDADQVRPLLPGTPGCLALVTSRNQLTSLVAEEDAQPLTLDVLTEAEARELLARRLGRERVTGEPEAVSELIGLCARLPRALAMIAARAAIQPRRPLIKLVHEFP